MGKRLERRWSVGVLVLAAAALAVAGGCSGRKGQTTYETKPVDRGDITAKVTATGSLSAIVTVQVGSQVSGRVQALLTDFNQQVKKGQIIARLDPELFEAAVAQARANLSAAKANVVKAQAQAKDARRQYERAKALVGEKLVAQADVDTLESTAEAAEAQVLSAQASLEQSTAALHQAEVNLSYATISSPIDGIVISRDVDVGQTVAASLQAPTLFTIAEDLRKMQVDTSVAEADVGKLAPGQPAFFTVDAYPDRRFRGTIAQIRNAPKTLQNVVTYDSVIDVDNPDLALKPGMTANVTFIYDKRQAVLRVPNAALRFRPPGTPAAQPERQPVARGGAPGGAAGPSASGAPSGAGGPGGATRPAAAVAPGTGGSSAPGGGWSGRPRSDSGAPGERTVWVLRGPEPVAVKIRTGITDGSFTEVLSGELNEGDAVVVDSNQPAGGSQQGGQQRMGPGRLF